MISHSSARGNNMRLAGWVAAMALMLGANALAPFVGDRVSMALVGAGAILSLALCTYWFARLDEVAQRAHYVAWFWGGSLGFAAAALILLTTLLTGIADMDAMHAFATGLFGGAAFEHGVSTGVVMVAAPMFIGYTVWWTVFWLRHR